MSTNLIQCECHECHDSFTLTAKQLNFQRLVKGRFNFVLCAVCDKALADKKWEEKCKHEEAERLLIKNISAFRVRKNQEEFLKNQEEFKRARKNLKKFLKN